MAGLAQGPDPSLARLAFLVTLGDQEDNQKLNSFSVATEYLGLEGLGLVSTQSVTEQIKRDSWWHPNYTTLNGREDASIIINIKDQSAGSSVNHINY